MAVGDEAGARTGQLEHLRPGGRKDEQGDVGAALRQVVHEGEHRLVGPVQVFDDEHGGTRRGEAFEELAPRREVLVARGLLGLEAEQRPQAGAQAVAVLALRQHGLEARLAARHAVALEDAGRSADDL